MRLLRTPWQFVGRALRRPTVLSQLSSALSALALTTLLTRSLSATSFASYSAILATFAFGNALIGTTIGTRLIKHLSQGGDNRITLVAQRDLIPMAGCVLAAAVTAVAAHTTFTVALAAGAGMLGSLATEISNAYLLGRRRYWAFFGVMAVRNTLWVGFAIAAVSILPADHRLTGALIATVAGAVAPCAAVAAWAKVRVVRRSTTHGGAVVSSVGLTNLALWLMASADRVILAHYAVIAAAAYAAIYGLLDRIFRSIANAELQYRLPLAFSRAGTNAQPTKISWRHAMGFVLVGIVCAAVGPSLVSVISGGRYRPGHWLTLVLCLGMMAMLAAVPSYVTLVACGRTRIAATIAGVGATINVLGNLTLATTYGTDSAAALTLVGYSVWLLGTLTAARRATGHQHVRGRARA